MSARQGRPIPWRAALSPGRAYFLNSYFVFKDSGLAKAQKSSIPGGGSLGVGGAAVLDELSRTKLGRRARIRGTVEQIVG
jgi:hypothetical protein